MTTPSYQYPPVVTPQPRKNSVLIPIGATAVALVVLVIVFFIGGDTATGIGRAGLVAVIIGAIGIIGGIVALITRRALAGFAGLVLLGLGALFAALGIADNGSYVTISIKRNDIKSAANIVNSKPLRATNLKQEVGI